MTYDLEIQIEKLRAELRNADPAERAQIEAELEQARAELAETELARVKRLVAAGHMPVDNLDRARAEARQANAALRSSRFAVEVARHERDNARATLAVDGGEQSRRPYTVTAPVDGLVLARQRQSEGMVQAGEPILLLGDLASLEVEVTLGGAEELIYFTETHLADAKACLTLQQ